MIIPLFWILYFHAYLITGKDYNLLPVESMCAAKCFSKYFNSMAGTKIGDHLKLYLKDIQDYCESEVGSCSMCLQLCQDQNVSNCNTLCEGILTENPNPGSNQWFNNGTCNEMCYENQKNRHNLEEYERTPEYLSCPSRDSWSTECRTKCKTDHDCMGIGFKCCHDNVSCQQKLGSHQTLDYKNKYLGNNSLTDTGTCLTAVIKSEFYTPPVPKQPDIKTLIRKSNADFIDEKSANFEVFAELSWNDYYTGMDSDERRKIQGPVVFLMQVRQFVDKNGIIGKNLKMLEKDSVLNNIFSTWYNLKWTSLLMAELRDLPENTWFQFRLRSYNEFGSGGWSRPTKPIQVKHPNVNINRPKNLMETRTRVHDNLVDVTVNWDLPEDGNYDLQKIYWCEYYDKQFTWNTMDSVLTKTDQKFTITNLKPNSTYRIQLTSLLNVNDQVYESQPNELYIKTTSVKQNPEYDGFFQKSPARIDDDTCNCDMNKEVMNFDDHLKLIRVYPFWESDELKANLKVDLDKIFPNRDVYKSLYSIEWIPHACIENFQPNEISNNLNPTKSFKLDANSLNSYTLRNLKFQCHYKLVLNSNMPNKFNRNAYRSCFCTPSCEKIEIVSGKRPSNCFMPENRPPEKPINIAYSIRRSDDMKKSTSRYMWTKNHYQNDQPKELYEAAISWKYPSPTNSRADYVKPRGFRIVYGPRLYEPVGPAYEYGLRPKIDYDKSITRVLGPESNQINLDNLERNTVYVVKLQSIGKDVDSQVESINFITPTTEVDKSSTRRPHFGYKGYYHSNSAAQMTQFIPNLVIIMISFVTAQIIM